MIISFPGQILPDALPAELARLSRWLKQSGIEAVANAALYVDLIQDNELVQLKLDGVDQDLQFLNVPNMVASELFEVGRDPIDDVQATIYRSMPMTLRKSQKVAALRHFAGPLRSPVVPTSKYALAGGCEHLERIQYQVLVDLLRSAWDLTDSESELIFLTGNDADVHGRNPKFMLSLEHVARARAAITLHQELAQSSIVSYRTWFRTQWPELSPIGTATPVEALIRGGISAFKVISGYLEFQRVTLSAHNE